VKWDCLSIIGVLLNESSLVDAVSTHAILILGKRIESFGKDVVVATATTCT
jgi:hypothetical protein